jgi:hypothetical protein
VRAALAILASLGAGCGLAASSGPGRDRRADEKAILKEVLAYEIKQFHGPDHNSESICVGVATARGVSDPSDELLNSLQSGVIRYSGCPSDTAVKLVAGPVEWLKKDEVRVKGSHAHGNTDTALLYRVTWDSGRWACLGPIIGYDPL